MKKDAFASFMLTLAKEAKKYKPLLAGAVEDFERLRLEAAERKPTGGLTTRARQAVQALRNSFLRTAHPNAAAAAAARTVEAAGKQFGVDAEKAVKSWALLYQAEIEFGIHANKETAFPPSREAGPFESKDDVVRFVSELRLRGVPPYALGRMRTYQYDIIARLTDDANDDREFQRPNNLWRWMVRCGVLQAYQDKIELSDDEARLLAEVAVFHDDPESFPMREKLEARQDKLFDLHPGFAAACLSLLENSDELTDGESDALFAASGRRFHEHTRTIATLLELGPDETNKVDAFIKFVETLRYEGCGTEDKLSWIVHALKTHIDALDERCASPAEWLPAISQTFLQPGGLIDRNVPDADSFWALLALALERSRPHEAYAAERDREIEDLLEADRQYRIGMYKSGEISFFVDAEGEAHAGHPADGQDVQYFVKFDHDEVSADRPDSDEQTNADDFVKLTEDAPCPSMPVKNDDRDAISENLNNGLGRVSRISTGNSQKSQAPDPKIEVLSPRERRDFDGNLFEGIE